MQRDKDFTPTGIKISGAYENDRNADSSELFKAIVRETCGCQDVIVAHHIVYVTTEERDGFHYEIVEEIPSADALIFDHRIARTLWGDDFKDILCQLAAEPPETRDVLLAELYRHRGEPQLAAVGAHEEESE